MANSRPGELWTPQEAADWLKVEPSQLARLGVPQYFVTRKTVRYVPEDVWAWLAGHRRNGRAA